MPDELEVVGVRISVYRPIIVETTTRLHVQYEVQVKCVHVY